METAGKTTSAQRVNSRSSASRITEQSPKSLPSRESCREVDQWSTSKPRRRGGRCDEPSGSEHLSRCVIPLDKSFHRHLRRAFRGAEGGPEPARPEGPFNKVQARGVGTEKSNKNRKRKRKKVIHLLTTLSSNLAFKALSKII